MAQSPTETQYCVWQVPQAERPIEYDPAVLEDIRTAVVDAFFSVPRGGAEIGGVLFGRRVEGCVRIMEYRTLECEHAFGPSFVLSPADHAGLAVLLEAPLREPELHGLVPVGWYHSHTRSEIFLSEQDLEIHRRYFPEPWQVALVLKPHAFRPTRAGFFFRQADATMQAESSLLEFVLQPRAGRPQAPQPPAAEVPKYNGHNRAAVLEAPPALLSAEPEEAPPQPIPPPRFATADQKTHWVTWICLALTLAIATGAGAYQTRAQWMRYLPAPPAARAAALELAAVDQQGQLQIRWNGAVPALRHASAGVLEIVDGGARIAVSLPPERLQGGTFTYGRQSERVDVRLRLEQPNGSPVEGFTSYLGKLPPPRPTPEEMVLLTRNQELEQQAKVLEGQKRNLERTVLDLLGRIRKAEGEQRLRNQTPAQP